MELVLIEKVLISIALGALLGTERHLSQLQHEDKIAGPRTFALVALFGSLSAHLSLDYPYGPCSWGCFHLPGYRCLLEGEPTLCWTDHRDGIDLCLSPGGAMLC
jgi:hypothetical protein